MTVEPSFPAAVRTIVRHLEGARGDVSERQLNAALLRVLPTLRDVSQEIKAHDRSPARRK